MKMKAECCKCCGGVVEFPEGKEAMVCSWCGTWNKLLDERVREREDFKNARALQLRGEFCDAEASYQRVLDDVPDDADALWGRLLCHYGAALVTEEGEQRKYTIRIPRSKPLRAYGDFERACENALPEIRAQYEQDAAYIDTAMARIRELAATKPPYDIFICHKTSNPNGVGYTEDYGRAYDLRNLLVQQGYRVFFAPVEMEGVSAGENYEAGIYHALDTAKVMLVICSDPALVSSTWVESEWQRYLSLRDEGRQVALIPLLYGGMKASALPCAFHVRSLQAIKMELDGKDRLLSRLQALIPREKPVEVKRVQPVQPQPGPVQTPVPAPVQHPAPQQPSAPVQTTGKRGNPVLKWLLLLCAMLAVGIGSVYVYAQMQGAAVRDTAMGQNSAVGTGLEAPTEIPMSTPAPLSEETPVPTVAAKNVSYEVSQSDSFGNMLEVTWADDGTVWCFSWLDITAHDAKLITVPERNSDFPSYEDGSVIVRIGKMEGEHTYQFFIYPMGEKHDGPVSYRFEYTFPPTPAPTEEAMIESIGYYWADYQISLEEWSMSPAILNQPLKNCTGFSFVLNLLNIKSGSPYGKWTLYGQMSNGAWVALEHFEASSDTTAVEVELNAPMDIYALCAVRKLHTECSHDYAFEISNPRYGDGTADGYYHYQLFRYYCTEHQQYRVGVNGNMVSTMRRNSSNASSEAAIEELRSFIVAGGVWQDRLSKYSSYHDAVNALLPRLNTGECHWVREWFYVLSPGPLEEKKSDSEYVEFGSIFYLNDEQWQGKCIKTPDQVSPTGYLDQSTGPVTR